MDVSEASKGYFHCGRCGRFFQSEIGRTLTRNCPHCAGDPAVGLDDRSESKLPAADAGVVRGMTVGDASAVAAPPAPVAHHGGRHRRSNPKLHRLVIFIAMWVLLLGGFAVVMKVLNDRREERESRHHEAYKRGRGDAAQGVPMKDQGLLKDNFPACREAFGKFLESSSAETRMQWVHGSVELAGPMTRFYQGNLPYRPEKAPKREFVGVVETPEGAVIESLWADADGRTIEAHFRDDDGEWRLDWEGFVRFSETPWVMFVAGGGKDVQEFRLLARERLAEERRLDPMISVVLHPPRFGVPDEAGPVSAEFEVPRLSEVGRGLEALFRLKREGKAPFGAQLPSRDPDEMIRVRLRVRRIDDDSKRRRFEIEELLAGHWMGIADSGIPEDDGDDGEGAGSAE